MAYNYTRARKVADRLIRKYGQTAGLKRGSTTYPCIVVETDFTPEERRTLTNVTARLFLVSTVGLTIEPTNETDKLVLYKPGISPATVKETLKITRPPGRLAPAGIVVYWELHVES